MFPSKTCHRWLIQPGILLALFLGLQSSTLSAQIAEESALALHGAHDALFASFIPIDQVSQNPELTAAFSRVREQIWSTAHASPDFQRMLEPFANLRSLGNTCGIADGQLSSGAYEFAKLSSAQRAHLLLLLQRCEVAAPRRLAMNARNFYLQQTYSALQEMLSGVQLHRFASQEYIEQHRPLLPPSRLRFDGQKNEVITSDGKEIDYLIVGSGPAGSVLAHELRGGGKRVVLVERGSFTVPGAIETRMVDSLIDSRTSTDGGIFIHNGMTVGGGTAVNVDLCFAPTTSGVRSKIESWRKDGLIGPNDFKQTQLADAYAWVKSAIGTRQLQESEMNANNRALWEGAKLAGLHPKLYDLNTYPPGKSPYPVTDKRSAESQLLIDALQDEQNSLSMIPDADVRRVIFAANSKSKTAVGVEIRMRAPVSGAGIISDPNHLGIAAGRTFEIHARNVILSAGALGSPTILLRSGLRNDRIGRGVILHVSMPVIGKFDHPINALSGTQASVYVDDKLVSDGWALEAMSAEPAYAAIMSPGTPEHALEMVKNYRYLAGFGVMLIDTPSAENRMTLDEHENPQITYEISEADKLRFRQGIAEAIRVMFLAGAKEVYLPTTESILGSGQDQTLHETVFTDIKQADAIIEKLRIIPNETIVTSAHMQATDKMGPDPEASVVDRDFHVWGTEGLYVVDGSIFPTSIGANPMQSIYTFAKIFADRMNASNNSASPPDK
jgi:choline dehydrogenase-like flavoprotein